MQQKDNLYGLEALRVNVGNSRIIGVTVVATQSALVLRCFSGGSLLIAGSSAQLIDNQGYLITGPLNMSMCGTFYLMANGATSICSILKGLS